MNAFNIFREAMHQSEYVRLCALWDAATIDRESIPTAVELVDDEAVIELILEHQVTKAVQELHQKLGHERAEHAAVELREIIRSVRDFRKSDDVKSMRRLRDQKVAHNLVEGTVCEVETISPMNTAMSVRCLSNGEHRQTLYRWINATGIFVCCLPRE